MRVPTAAMVCGIVLLIATFQIALAQEKKTERVLEPSLECKDFPELCNCQRNPSACTGLVPDVKVIRTFKEAGRNKAELEALGRHLNVDCSDLKGLC
jgi:hypothetical protein